MTLTKELELHFDLAKKGVSNRIPKWQTTAKKFQLTKPQVKEAQDLYRIKIGDRPRGFELPFEEPAKEEKQPWHEKAKTIFDWLVDGGALALAIMIDLVLNVVVFVTIAPDTLTKIGMSGLAFLVVLFGLRGWLKYPNETVYWAYMESLFSNKPEKVTCKRCLSKLAA